ncbi:MAG: hypothetical protein RRA92_07760, partial [Gemmatimonadota bacterium]|nr:hypothetical protein [Gemmatimonadota bacterium]
MRSAARPLLRPGAVAGMVCVLALSACTDDDPVASTDPPASCATLVAEAGTAEELNPWRNLSDAALATCVAEADGRVFLVIKEPGADRPSDDKGQSLVPPAVFEAALADLLARGLTFERVYEDMPIVITHLEVARVPEIRALPYIHAIEAIIPGS